MENNDEYLIHYGVKGMKWGVRRKSSSYYSGKSDSLKKKNVKYASKVATTNAKASKYEKKAIKTAKRGDTDKSTKYSMKAANLRQKSAKYQKKIANNMKLSSAYNKKASQLKLEEDKLAAAEEFIKRFD